MNDRQTQHSGLHDLTGFLRSKTPRISEARLRAFAAGELGMTELELRKANESDGWSLPLHPASAKLTARILLRGEHRALRKAVSKVRTAAGLA